ncbi:MAG: NAD-dependent epimerase/dehydratase family protein [Usitatibacter sp.]
MSTLAFSDPAPLASEYSGKRVVVTGASGFLGTALTRVLRDVDCEIVRVARRCVPVRGAKAQVIDVAGDVREARTWAGALAGADYVFHLAAQTSALVADADRDADFECNVRPVEHLVAACRKAARAPVVAFAGSVTQAVESGEAPPGAYEEHKLLAERLLEKSARDDGLRAVTLRLSNLYGPGPLGGSSERGVLNRMIRKALLGESLTVYGSGEFVRDYLHVDDAARAFLAAGDGIERLGAGAYVVGSGSGHTIAEAFALVAERVAQRTGRRVPVVHVEPAHALTPLQMRSFVADASAFTAATGWRARFTLAAGIDQTIGLGR